MLKLRKFKLRKFKENEDGLIVAAIVIIIAMVVGILFMSTIAATIIPVAIFLVLAIVMALIVKNMIAPGKRLGIVRGLTGATREAGKVGVELYESAKGEFRRRR